MTIPLLVLILLTMWGFTRVVGSMVMVLLGGFAVLLIMTSLLVFL